MRAELIDSDQTSVPARVPGDEGERTPEPLEHCRPSTPVAVGEGALVHSVGVEELAVEKHPGARRAVLSVPEEFDAFAEHRLEIASRRQWIEPQGIVDPGETTPGCAPRYELKSQRAGDRTPPAGAEARHPRVRPTRAH